MSLHDLVEIYELWGVTVRRIYRDVAEGKLHAFGRRGHQKYYAHHELTSLYGEPTNSPQSPQNRARSNGETAKGGQQQDFEFAAGAAAA